MSEILHIEIPDGPVHRLRRPGDVLDAATAAVVDAAVTAAVAEAKETAYRDGQAAGLASATAAADRACAAIGELRAELAEQRRAAIGVDLEFAAAVAGAVLDRTPPDDAVRVLEGVRRAVEVLDDAPLRIRMSPTDHAALGNASVPLGAELVADPSLPPGEARVVGANSGVELTRAALLAAALDVLGEETA